MKMSELTALALQYDALLCRYAGFIVKHKPSAARIVMAVFEDHFDSPVQLDGKPLRTWLKSSTQRKCMEWLHYKTLFHVNKLSDSMYKIR